MSKIILDLTDYLNEEQNQFLPSVIPYFQLCRNKIGSLFWTTRINCDGKCIYVDILMCGKFSLSLAFFAHKLILRTHFMIYS